MFGVAAIVNFATCRHLPRKSLTLSLLMKPLPSASATIILCVTSLTTSKVAIPRTCSVAQRASSSQHWSE